MDWHTILIALHLIGTVLGVGGATFAEIFLLKSLRDGEIDPLESSFLKVTYRVIRIGLALLVLSGFGFLILYRLTGLEERLLSPLLWAKLAIVGIILANAILLQARKIPLWLGSALSLASWYGAMLIIPLRSVFKSINAGFFDVILIYAAFVIITATILFGIRRALGIRH